MFSSGFIIILDKFDIVYRKFSEFKVHKGNLIERDVTLETSKNVSQVFSHFWHVVLSLEKINWANCSFVQSELDFS